MNLESACSTLLPLDFLKNNPDARFSRLYFCHSLNRLQRGLSAIAELLVSLYVVRGLRALDMLLVLIKAITSYILAYLIT